MMRPMQTLGDRIKIGRERVGLSQAEVGRRIGVKSQSVNQWEHSVKFPSRTNLLRFAEATGVSVGWLMYGGPLPDRVVGDSLTTGLSGGHLVPMLSIRDAIKGVAPGNDSQKVLAHFPCSARSFYFPLPDDSNAPIYPTGTHWILDPERLPLPGNMVLAAYGERRDPVIGELRRETTAKGETMIVQPLNPKWPAARSDLDVLEIIGVMTESTVPGP